MNPSHEQHHNADEVEQQPQTTTTTAKKKKITVLRKISAKPAPKKTSLNRSTATDDVPALPATNSRGENDDDDDEQQQPEQQQQAPPPRPTATRKSASLKPQAKKSTTSTRSAEQNDFDAAVAFLHATAPSQASIITANAVAAVEAMERKEAEEQQRRRQAEEVKQQAPTATTAACSSSSSEPLLSCSECHQQLPKSEFSSSQAKKLVGRKCKQCVAKVAEIEAQLREEAAVNEVLEKINELPKIEQSQRKSILALEHEAFLQLSQRISTRRHPNNPHCAVRLDCAALCNAPVRLGDDGRWEFVANPHCEEHTQFLREKGWTVIGLFSSLSHCASRDSEWETVAVQNSLDCCCRTLRLINSLIDAGAMDMLPQPWCNQRNPMQLVKSLFEDSLQRLGQRADPLELHGTDVYLFGDHCLGAELLICVLSILQHGDTAAARATEADIVEFIKFLVEVEVARAYYPTDPTVAPAMNDLIRFLFFRQSNNHNSRCFVARLLGLNDNNIPEQIVNWLALLLAECHRIDPANAFWWELVADLFSHVLPTVVASLLRQEPPNDTLRFYNHIVKRPNRKLWTFFHSLTTASAADIGESAAAHRARAVAAIDEALKHISTTLAQLPVVRALPSGSAAAAAV